MNSTVEEKANQEIIKTIEFIGELRKKIDAVAQLVDYPDLRSAETVKCHNNLLMAKAFAGKIMGELGTPSPYQNDGSRKTVQDIEPTAERASQEEIDIWPIYPENSKPINEWNRIEKVDFLRQVIDELKKSHLFPLSEKLKSFTYLINSGDLNDSAIRINYFESEIFLSLTKARIWLGFELERIRKADEKENSRSN